MKELDSSGVEKVRDVLPPGEFSSLESLPPLPPPVDRRTHVVKEGDPCVLDCPLLRPGAKHWRRNDANLTVAFLYHRYGARTFVDADFRLHFQPLDFNDSALYRCDSSRYKLIHTGYLSFMKYHRNTKIYLHHLNQRILAFTANITI